MVTTPQQAFPYNSHFSDIPEWSLFLLTSWPRWLNWMCLTADQQEVVGLTPASSATSFLGDWRGWLGGVKVSHILHHRGIQLILAYSWAKTAILVAGKGRGGMFLFLLVSLLSFLFPFLPYSSLSSLLLSLLSLFSFSLGDDTKWPTRVDMSLNPNTNSWRLIIKYFLHSFSSADSRQAVVSFWWKNGHILVNRLED